MLLFNLINYELISNQPFFIDMHDFSKKDKVLINALTMIAEDYSTAFPESCAAIYQLIHQRLCSKTLRPECKLSLVYLVDSILKNVRGFFTKIMAPKISEWMKPLFDELKEDANGKLRRVWDTWKTNNFSIFSEEEWAKMGKCFIAQDAKAKHKDTKAKKAGIIKNADGSLKLPSALRKKMQLILDDMNQDVEELERVSLERLANINLDLLIKIKENGQELLTNQQIENGNGVNGQRPIDLDGGVGGNSFTEFRSAELVKRCQEWEKIDLDPMDKGNEVIGLLQKRVRVESTSGKGFPGPEIDGNKLLGVSSALATYLSSMLTNFSQLSKNVDTLTMKGIRVTTPQTVDKSKFTSDGLKQKDESAILRLYAGGLPFICNLDGRRFATATEMQRHYDKIFVQNRVKETMERTEERSWYQEEEIWTGQKQETRGTAIDGAEGETSDQVDDPMADTVTADEARDKCGICATKFEMFYDQDDGEWKYKNCREIIVDNGDDESENILIRSSCWKGLGSPDFLTKDQIVVHMDE